jgi:hypothetical protein
MTLLDRPAIAKPTARPVDERDCLLEQVAKLWLDGLSQTQIAQALGFTDRGVISGLISRARKRNDSRFRQRPRQPGQTRERRLELDRARKARKRNGLPPLRPPAANPAPKIRVVKPSGEEVGNRRRVSPSPEPPKPRLLVELQLNLCRFPVSNPPPGRGNEMLFCSETVARPGANYCSRHAEIATRVVSRAPLR